MKTKDIDKITEKVAKKFPTFGGGQTVMGNPIAQAMKDRPPMFTTGCDVEEVVKYVLQLAKK